MYSPIAMPGRGTGCHRLSACPLPYKLAMFLAGQLTSSSVENIPNGKFSMEKSESSATGRNDLRTMVCKRQKNVQRDWNAERSE